ncbi:hypothetical protein BAS10_04525 [Elizabethkingia meningoseptica]|uniref:hypothetical protein n=1 Tax=Elizabethkingia meningoseptica TaxID=238 RepID=UPI00099ACDD7|nr:hypothetical protein [Elizabethkingia meningoseptica]OPB98939.1 hypothetical protein BAS10_04525 [Elizabethkingia meningoseptica]
MDNTVFVVDIEHNFDNCPPIAICTSMEEVDKVITELKSGDLYPLDEFTITPMELNKIRNEM